LKDKLLDTIEYLKSKGVDYADIRLVRTETERLKVKDLTVDSIVHDVDQGIGIRVIADGAWGFAASSSVKSGSFRKTANRALQVAKASALTKKGNVILAETEVHQDRYETAFEIDPFKIRLNKKIDLLLKANKLLKRKKLIHMAESQMDFFKIHQIFASTEGSLIEQDILQSGGGYCATAVDGSEVQRRSYPTSFGGDYACAGYEFIEGLQLLENAERVREEAIALLKAPPMPAGAADVILGSSQMALQVHESCGHPSELDRVLGTEISLAGGSFLSLDQAGKLKYGSDIVNIYADATVQGGLGSFGYDDEGVKAQRAPIVKNGMFVGYLTSRETAPVVDQKSNGTMRADGWNSLPLIRMTNHNLEPGDAKIDDLIADTEGGYMLETNKSWSIDDKRLNFQFGCEIAWKIENGKRGQIYKNPLYTGMTPKFWNSCDAICDRSHWHVWGIPNCGKGEPMQTAHVAHGAAPTRFRQIEVGVSK
jgi:TldD protein